MYHDVHGNNKEIEVISSDSACVGETLVALKIMELEEKGLSFEEVVAGARDFLDKMTTLFVLESMDFLKKNGRLTGVTAMLVTALNIKPLMRGNHGVIEKLDQARGLQKALKKLVEYVEKEAKNPEERILAITHCNCYERAVAVRDSILSKVAFKEAMIVDAAGVSSLYAGDGGIVVTY
jgi:DegV family protein with EDD domain